MFLCMWYHCDPLRQFPHCNFNIWSFRCSFIVQFAQCLKLQMLRCYALLLKCLQFQMLLMLCTFTAVSVVPFSLMLGSFAILSAVLDTPNVVCSFVCSFRCSDFVHNCQMLWCALLWQCLQFPNHLGYAHLPQHLESQILWWCALLLVCCCFRWSDVVQCYCSVCHFRCSNIVQCYPVCGVSYCPTLCVITTVSSVSSASTSFTVTTVSVVSDVIMLCTLTTVPTGFNVACEMFLQYLGFQMPLPQKVWSSILYSLWLLLQCKWGLCSYSIDW